MTVAQLIKHLQEYSGDLLVVMPSGYDPYCDIAPPHMIMLKWDNMEGRMPALTLAEGSDYLDEYMELRDA